MYLFRLIRLNCGIIIITYVTVLSLADTTVGNGQFPVLYDSIGYVVILLTKAAEYATRLLQSPVCGSPHDY